jgi:hypothetical protein
VREPDAQASCMPETPRMSRDADSEMPGQAAAGTPGTRHDHPRRQRAAVCRNRRRRIRRHRRAMRQRHALSSAPHLPAGDPALADHDAADDLAAALLFRMWALASGRPLPSGPPARLSAEQLIAFWADDMISLPAGRHALRIVH